MNKELKRKLALAIEGAWLKRAERGAFHTAKVVTDLLSDAELMSAVQNPILTDVLTLMSKRSMQGKNVDPRQLRLPGIDFAPALIGISGGEWIAFEKSTHEQVLAFTLSFEAKLQARIKRSKIKTTPDFSRDKKTLEVLQRAGRILGRYSGKNPAVTLEEALQIREARKTELQRDRKARRARSSENRH